MIDSRSLRLPLRHLEAEPPRIFPARAGDITKEVSVNFKRTKIVILIDLCFIKKKKIFPSNVTPLERTNQRRAV